MSSCESELNWTSLSAANTGPAAASSLATIASTCMYWTGVPVAWCRKLRNVWLIRVPAAAAVRLPQRCPATAAPMLRVNRLRNTKPCSDRITGRRRNCRDGNVQTNTPAYQAITSNMSASANHSHHCEYGGVPLTNRSRSSGTGEHLRQLDQPVSDFRAAGDGGVRNRVRGHEFR